MSIPAKHSRASRSSGIWRPPSQPDRKQRVNTLQGIARREASGWDGLDTERGSSLIGERYRGKELLLGHPCAGLREKDEASQSMMLVLDAKADRFAGQSQRVETPPDPPPADVAVALDHRPDGVGKRGVEPATPQAEEALQLGGHG